MIREGGRIVQNGVETDPPSNFRPAEKAWIARTVADKRHIFSYGLPKCGEINQETAENFGFQLRWIGHWM